MPVARISLCSALVAAVCLMLAACAGTIAPNRWLETPGVTQHEAYGSWARLETGTPDMTHTEGELIAVTLDSIFILDTLGFLSGFSAQDVGRVHLQSFDSRHGLVAFWTVLGTLSTVSHGVVLIISAPVWIISGSIAAGSQSKTAHEYAVPSEWLALAKYARFPQGLPPGIDRSRLKIKPFHKSSQPPELAGD